METRILDDSIPRPAARRWLIATRPFALPASTTPVLFGTALAIAFGGAPFHPWLFLMALLAMILLHSGANMLSDVNDDRKGLDKVATPASGAIVRGWLSADQVRSGAFVLLAAGSAIGLAMVRVVGRPILWIGLVGVAIGVLYTVAPVALKYRGLGDLAVFLDFGVLGSLGAWTVQAGHCSWLPVVWAIPMSLLVVAILHANNWRDIPTDTDKHVTTMASRLGDRGSLAYYGFLIFAPFLLVLALVALRAVRPDAPFSMPPAFLLTWMALPMALTRWRRALRRRAPEHPLDFVALDGASAQLDLAFGLLCTMAALADLLIRRFHG